jgi:hypothetical protein
MNPAEMFTEFKAAVIAKDGQLSTEVDLGGIYKRVLLLIPAIDTAQISVRVAKESGGTFYPVHTFTYADGDGTVLQATASGTGEISVPFDVGGAEFLKVYASAAQTTAERTVYVRGIR